LTGGGSAGAAAYRCSGGGEAGDDRPQSGGTLRFGTTEGLYD
jgi:hypothetical protein